MNANAKEAPLTKTIIGIDPDLVKSGVAMVQNGTIQGMTSMDFWQLCKHIDECVALGFVFVLEDVEANNFTYARHSKKYKPKVVQKIMQNVGQVKAISRLIQQYLEGAGAEYYMVKPLVARYMKDCKKDSAKFNARFGWSGRSNEDQRDAAMLAIAGPPTNLQRKMQCKNT